jgi:hypothetical protein
MRTRLQRIVIVESPYRADSTRGLAINLAYCRALCRHVVERGDSPSASHLDLTQCLDDMDPKQRELGIAAGLARLRAADIHLFGTDRGWSYGMNEAKKATPARVSYEEVSLPEWAEALTEDAKGNHCELDALVSRFQPMWRVR